MLALPRWPAVGKLQRAEPLDEAGRLLKARQRRQRLQQSRWIRQHSRRCKQDTHDWVSFGNRTRCADCLRTKTADVGPCTGESPLVPLVAQAQALGHRIFAAEVSGKHTALAGAAIVVCKFCGGWAQGTRRGRGLKLLRPCLPPTAAGRQAWDRLSRGLHPTGGMEFRAVRVLRLLPWPVSSAGEAEEAEGRTD